MSGDKNIVNLTSKTFSSRDGNTVHQLVANRSIVRTTTDGNQTFTSRTVEVQTTVSKNSIETNDGDLMKTYFKRTIQPETVPKTLSSQVRNIFRPKNEASAKTGVDKKQFAAQCLQSHNEYRKMHGADPLKLDQTIMKHAQSWAETMASRDRMEHNPDRRYGENVYACGGFVPTGEKAVGAWYDEISQYDFNRPGFKSGTGHFTAVVWCGSRHMGIGVAQSASGKVYVVASYDPPGNVIDYFQQNVLPKKGQQHKSQTNVSTQPASVSSTSSSQVRNGFLPKNEVSARTTIDKKEFAAECLQLHNVYRQMHGAGPLSLDETIMKYAQKWAETIASRDRMEHNPDRRYGENVFACGGFVPTGQQAVGAWYDEIFQYDFNQPGFKSGTGHFTAVVWCGSRSMGIGVAQSASGKVYVVANYDPPGNVLNHFQQNVLPKKNLALK